MDTTEIFIQGASTFIALAALWVAVYEGRSNRKHNRLSLAPRLAITHHLYGSKGYLGLSVFNTGPGPAIIQQCDLMVDGKLVNGWGNAAKLLGLEELGLGCDHIAPGSMSPNERRWLLFVRAGSDNSQYIKALNNALPRIYLGITYSSVYGEKFYIDYGSRKET
jgi:hypothetical protein